MEREKKKQRTVWLTNMIWLPHYCTVLRSSYLTQCYRLISNSIRFQAERIVFSIHVYLSCMLYVHSNSRTTFFLFLFLFHLLYCLIRVKVNNAVQFAISNNIFYFTQFNVPSCSDHMKNFRFLIIIIFLLLIIIINVK